MRSMMISSLTVTCWWLLAAPGVIAAAEPAESAEAKESKAAPTIEPAAVSLDRAVDFDKDVLPILEEKCIACHYVGGDESKLVLENVKAIHSGGKHGPSVVAKMPAESLLYQLASRAKDPAMPPLPNDVEAEALTPQELGLLQQWILEGAAAGAGSAPSTINFQPVPERVKPIYSVALSPWGRLAATGRANQIFVYDLEAGEEVARLVDPELGKLEHEGHPLYAAGAAHRDFVHSFAFNHDGTLLASGGYRVVKLWQRPKNVQLRQIACGGGVTTVAVSSDGQWAACGLADHRVQLFNLGDGSLGPILEGHTASVTGLAFVSATETETANEPPKLISSALDNSVRIWALADGAAISQIDTPSPVNGIAVSTDAAQVISAGADHVIRIWNLPQASSAATPAEETAPPENAVAVNPVLELKGHEKGVTCIDLVGPSGAQLISGSEDGTLRVWNLKEGKAVRTMSHGGAVAAVSVRPDGQVAASAGLNGVAKLWQLSDGKAVAEMKGDLAAIRNVGQITENQTVAKQHVALAKGEVKAAEANQKDREESAKKAQEAKTAAAKAVEETAKKEKEAGEKNEAAKAKLAESKENEDLKKKAAEAEKAFTTAQEASKKAVQAQMAAVRGETLAQKAIESAKQRLEHVKAAAAAVEENLSKIAARLTAAQEAAKALQVPIRAVVFSADGKTIATAGDGHAIQLYNGANGKPLDLLSVDTGNIAALAFAAGNVLISGSVDGMASVWDVNPSWNLIGRFGRSEEDPLDFNASPFVGRVVSLDFSPDGTLLATGGGEPSRGGELMFWDVAKRTLVRTVEQAHSDTVLGVEFSRDGKLLASGAADKFVKIFEVETGKHVRSFEGHTHHVLDVTWKADGATLASAGADNAIKVWNVKTGEQRRTISNYKKQVTAIQYVGLDDTIVSCGGDKSVRFHKTTNGQNFRSFGGGTDYMYAAAATRDAATVVAGGEDGVLRVWNGKDGKSQRTFDPTKASQ